MHLWREGGIAIELFSLFATIGLNASGFNQGVDDATKKGEGFGSKVGSSIAKFGKVAAAGLGVAATAFTGLATKALSLGGELEQNLGGAEAVFGEFADTVKDVGENAFKTMGLSMSDFLATANKMGALFQGSGFGIEESANLASTAMQRAADVASIMGIDTSAAMEAVAGAAKGNFTMMDNLGVAMNATTLEAYALSKGINTSYSAMSNQQKIGLAMEMFLDKTAYAAGNYAKENDTLAGSLSTAKAALTNFLSGAGDVGPFVDALTNAGMVITRNLQALLPRLAKGVFAIAKQLVPMVGPLFKELLPVVVEGASAILEGVVSVLPEIVDAISDILPQLIGAIIDMLPMMMTAGVDIIISLVTGIGKALPTLIPAMVDAVLLMASTLFNSAPELLSAGFDLMVNLAAGIFSGLGQITGAIAEVWDSIKLAAGQVWPIISGAITSAWDAVKNLGVDVWTNLSTAVTGAWDTVKELAGTAWTNLSDAVSNAWDTVKGLASTVWSALSTAVTGAWDAVKGLLGSTWTTLSDGVKSAWDAVKGLGTTAWSALSDAVKGAWDSVKGLASTAWSSLSDAVSGAWDAVKGLAGDTWSTVSGSVSDAWETVKKLGKDVWEGISGAVTKAWSTIKGAFGEAAVFDTFSSAIGVLKENIDIVIPLVSGLAAGIIAYNLAQKVSAAVTAIATAAMKLFNGEMALSPVGLVVAAVVGLGVALAALGSKLKQATAEQKALEDTVKSNKEAYDDLQETLAQNAASFGDNVAEIDANASAISKLVENVYTLSAAEDDSAEGKAKLAAAVSILNTAVPELGLAYDAETGALSKTVEQVNAYVKAKQAEAKLTAINERAIEIAKEMVEIEEKRNTVMQTQEAIYDAAMRKEGETAELYEQNAAIIEGYTEEIRLKGEALDFVSNLGVETAKILQESEIAQGTAITETTNIMLAAYATQEALVAQRKAADDAATDAMILNANELGLTLDEYVEQEKKRAQEEEEALKQREATLASYVEAATDMFSKINTSGTATANNMIKTLEHNATAMTNWGTNIQKALELGLDPGIVQQFIDQGPKAAAGELQSLMSDMDKYRDGGVAKAQEMNVAFANAGTASEVAATSVETAETAMGTAAEVATTSATEFTTAAETITASATEFTTAATDVTTSATGLSTGITDAETAITTFGTTMTSVKEQIDLWATDMNAIASTSVPEIVDSIILKYTTLPTSINTSYALVLTMTQEWVNNMISTATREIPRFVTAVVNTAQSLVEKMRTLGAQTARGWGEGFNSETGWVYAQIKAFIDRIVEDVKTGLDIHSPSGVSEEIGVSFAQGFVVGIQKMAGAISDTVSNVFNPEVSMMGFETGNVSMGSLRYAGGVSDGEIQTGGFQLIQNIQSVPQTPTELAATTALYFDRARWVKG